MQRERGCDRTGGFAARLILLAGLAASAFGQVSVTPDSTSAVGPGTFYPTVGVCNETNLPVKVQGYRFRTPNYAGYTTWLGGLSHTGAAPAEYTQPIPDVEQDMQSGQCRQATDYTGNIPGGQDGTMFDPQALIKTGTCAEAPKYTDAPANSCAEIDAIRAKASYESGACIVDTIGVNGGDAYGGFVSTFYGQTQIQVAIPGNTFQVNGTDVKWNPYKYGPQWMMALAGVQEIMNVDWQFMASDAAKETFMGLVIDPAGTPLGNVPVQAGVHGYWQAESPTFATWVKAYPQFFPKYGPCISQHPDVTSAFPACAPSIDDPGIFYLRPTKDTQMGPNSPEIINGAVSTAMGFYDIYDIMVLGTDLCFVDVIKNAKDPRVALAALLPGYNLGRNSGFAHHITDADIKTDPNASSRFPQGNSNYRTDVFHMLDQLVNAGKNCGGGRNVYDTALSLTEVQRFLFGGSNTPGTADAQGDGGLLLHYDIAKDQRAALWNEVTCAFGKLKGKAPSMKAAGKTDFISYRYDFLTLLRVVKKYLPVHIMNRRIPVEHDFDAAVKEYSASGKICGQSSRPIDNTYPTLNNITPKPGSTVNPVKTPGLTFSYHAVDAGGGTILKSEWTMDKNWGVWQPTRKGAGADMYEFDVSCELPGWPAAGKGGTLWVSTSDDCGNTTVQEVGFTVKPGSFCGQPPPPVQTAKPQANPADTSFNPLLGPISVVLSDATQDAVIYYTLDGTTPDTAKSPKYTAAISISKSTVLKAVAVAPGLTLSEVLTVTYTAAKPNTVDIMATPDSSQTFFGSLPFELGTMTGGATIHYTLNGAAGDVSGPSATHFTFTQTTHVVAYATKPGMLNSDTIDLVFTAIPPNSVKDAWYIDADGDGRIDGAAVVFASALAGPVDLSFTIVDEAGGSHSASVTAALPSGGNPARIDIVFASPFPADVTSFQASSHGHSPLQTRLALADADFPVRDAVAPVIVSASIHEFSDTNVEKSIDVTYSEKTQVNAGDKLALAFKRDGAVVADGDIVIDRVVMNSDKSYTFYFDAGAMRQPVKGDLISINVKGQTADAIGNKPVLPHFVPITGDDPASKPASVTITYPTNKPDPERGAANASQGTTVFIPVDVRGIALPSTASEDGKCVADCIAKVGDDFVGPVFHVVTPGPVAWEFKVFDKLGEFVSGGKGRLTAADLAGFPLVKGNYDVPVVWTGGTRTGRKAGTGAYILVSVLSTDKDPLQGTPAGQYLQRTIFGLIRN